MVDPLQCGREQIQLINGNEDLDPAGIFVVSFYIWKKFSKHIKLKLKYSR